MASHSRLPSRIEIGEYELDTWYSSPYPEEYVASGNTLYICEFCLTYMKSSETLQRHNSKCQLYCPPANEIYRSKHKVENAGIQELSVFEVDGAKSKLYCQNLCLLAKLFLDHKTLYYDVDHFLFYILTKNDNLGSRILGYFSKEKHCMQKNNVSCIMILPQYQSYGYGRFLIEFSYLLSKKENTLGTPEKPLSDLGRISYLKYWKYSIIDVINSRDSVTIQEISDATNMTIEDVLDALVSTNLLKQNPGENSQFSIYLSKQDEDKLKRPRLSVKPEDLRWTQYVSRYAKKINQDDRDEEEEGQEELSNCDEVVEDGREVAAFTDDEDALTTKSAASDATEIAAENLLERVPKHSPLSSCVDGY